MAVLFDKNNENSYPNSREHMQMYGNFYAFKTAL